MASLSLRHVYKVYPGTKQGGNVKAVSDFNLEISDKEFIVFVGPSGCGKSTTLRMIAGLEEISEGELYIDGRLVNDVEPKDRDIAMVFQNYALYPHMTVYDNMAFGLKLRKMPRDQIDARVKEAANILGIEPLLTRKPKALSGGQRQRVALGRAIVRETKVFLLDEPLSNLDAKLRVQMRTEITKLHHKLATTFIYVTHDQIEAMTMGTRIVVMKDGFMQQVDTPQNLYDNPVNYFVATFIGTPQMNMFEAMLEEEGDHLIVKFGDSSIKLPVSKSKRLTSRDYIGKKIYFGVRPEDIHEEQVFVESSPQTVINAEIDVIEKLGNETILYMKVAGKEDYTVARVSARSVSKAGESIRVALDAKHIHMFDAETELTILGIPAVNYVPAAVAEENGAKVLSFGKVKYALPADFNADAAIGKDILLGVKTANIYEDQYYEEPAPKVVVNASVGMIDNALFTDTTIAEDRYFVARLIDNPEKPIAQGDIIKLAFNINRCALYDAGTKELLADFEKFPQAPAETVTELGEFPLPKKFTPPDKVDFDAINAADANAAVSAAEAIDAAAKLAMKEAMKSVKKAAAAAKKKVEGAAAKVKETASKAKAKLAGDKKSAPKK